MPLSVELATLVLTASTKIVAAPLRALVTCLQYVIWTPPVV